MHELDLCEGVVEAICRRARGRSVRWARVRVGGHVMDPEVLSQGIALAAMGTEAENASFEIIADPMQVRCESCGATASLEDPLALTACARCGSLDVEVLGEQGAVLEAIGYEAARPTPAAGEGR